MRASWSWVSALLLATGGMPGAVLAQARGEVTRRGVTMGAVLGVSYSNFKPDTGSSQRVNDHAIGFDIQTVVWLRRFLGIRAAAGVDYFSGPVGPNGHDAGGSFGLASVALALRTPPKRSGLSLGVDVGASTVFEPTYSYSYTEGNVIYAYPDIELPLRGGPYVVGSLRGGRLFGWLVSYQHFLKQPTEAEGRMKGRVVVGLSVSR